MSNPTMTALGKKRDGGKKKVTGQLASQSTAHRPGAAQGGRNAMQEFAPLRSGNKVKAFTTGQAYYEDVYQAFKAAKKTIFIAGWQVNWDVELVPGERLIDVLKQALDASPSLRIYVMPWLSPKVGVNTGDFETMLAVFQLNAGRDSIRAMCCPAATQCDETDVESIMFSHHQKLVVVDDEIAYVGGIDLAWGRRDDATFSLAHGDRVLNERYNPGIPAMQEVANSVAGASSGGAATPYLTLMNLLTSSLISTEWDVGRNSDPSALAKLLQRLSSAADESALKAMAWASDGKFIVERGVLKAARFTQAVFDKGVQQAMVAVELTEQSVIDASRNVSRACKDIRTADIFGSIAGLSVAESPSTVAQEVRAVERAAVERWNSTVGWAEAYLSPLGRLRLKPDASTGAADAIESVKKTGTRVFNSAVNASAHRVRQVAGAARQACMEIAPATESAVGAINATARGASQTVARATAGAGDSVDQAQKFVAGEINAMQLAVLAQIQSLRLWWGDRLQIAASAAERAAVYAKDTALQKAEEFARRDGLTAQQLQVCIDQTGRLLKMVYLMQLSVAWAGVKAHPRLFGSGKKAKAAPVGGTCLSDLQPRQPWQDVHCRIEGPSVFDVAKNFIGRWNATQASYLSDQALADAGHILSAALGATGALAAKLPVVTATLVADRAGKSGGTLFAGFAERVRNKVMVPVRTPPAPIVAPASPEHTVRVQVLRSASRNLIEQEAKALGKQVSGINLQDEIQRQMVNLISNATDFIYIENQFFQSDYGMPSVAFEGKAGVDAESGPLRHIMSDRAVRVQVALTRIGRSNEAQVPPRNVISAALANRIVEAIRRNEPFHVYIVLPVHPEGSLANFTIIGQIHWTMQSLVFGSHSLVNRIRRGLWAKAHCANPLDDGQWREAIKAAEDGELGKERFRTEIQDKDWAPYLTLLNLRTCQVLTDSKSQSSALRTEQIYVHSKLLIVDDRHVIMGSANINDRSLHGGRDSELAVMILDDRKEDAVLRTERVKVNTFARKLRLALWEKHLGFHIKAGDGVVVRSGRSEFSVAIQMPAAGETIKMLQKIASSNEAKYTETFKFVPVGFSEEWNGSLWPTLPVAQRRDEVAARQAASEMPFSEDFWLKPFADAMNNDGVTGFFCRLPSYWTFEENNHPAGMSIKALSDANQHIHSDPHSVGVSHAA